MDHHRFKNEQTAAHYVASSLDPMTQEAFELHIMGCRECLDDVEAWRALKSHMPPQSTLLSAVGPATDATPSRARSIQGLHGWKMAASIAGVGIVGALAGWVGHASRTPLLGDETAVANLPPVTRGFDCTPLRLAPAIRVVMLRVPGATPDSRLVLRDLEGEELPREDYSLRVQADGSWLVRLDRSRALEDGIRLETRGEQRGVEPLGCVASTPLG